MKLPPCPPNTYFLTLRLADRRSDLLVREVGRLRHAVRATLAHQPFEIDACCILPALAHMIWVLPDDETGPGGRIMTLKRRFAQLGAADIPPAQLARASIWHRDHWVCRLDSALDHARHRSLIHHAPVEAGLCARPQDWPHSSLHRDLRHATAPVEGRLAEDPVAPQVLEAQEDLPLLQL